MKNWCQIKVFKKTLLNYWYTFTQMHNYVSISYSWFLWFYLILRLKSFICNLYNNSKQMKSYMLFLILYVVPIFKQNVYTYNMETSNWIIFIFLVGIVDIIVQMESKFIIEA
jgi:hypothetical protein